MTKRFAETTAVDELTLSIERGAFYALLGPSGCGKTTTLRMIGGFEDPTEGTVYLGGSDVTDLPPYRRDVNTVFQSYALFPHLSIFDNVAFGLRRKGVGKADVKQRVGEALELVDLTGREKRKPSQLSGGQQQRVALARALAYEPEVLLLDEPFGALDVRIRGQIRRSLKEIQRELKLTTILVTHDQEEAFELADRIGVVERGRLVEVGTAEELYARPRVLFTAT
ncbi:MAG TPA: ABC transporter ATP-binding protein, partial [Thermoleophilaceae bacterium]|nr:ABC transporter ATP-binding protein [Thermoleophilaceae bacterium]